MNERDTVGVIDNANLERLSVRRRSDEHRDVGIVSLEGSPVVSECVEHVVIGDTVLAGARLDVHPVMLGTEPTNVNIY